MQVKTMSPSDFLHLLEEVLRQRRLPSVYPSDRWVDCSQSVANGTDNGRLSRTLAENEGAISLCPINILRQWWMMADFGGKQLLISGL
jgi:hypothetical protein